MALLSCTALNRNVFAAAAIVLLLLIGFLGHQQGRPVRSLNISNTTPSLSSIASSLSLTDEQCSALYPHAFDEIDFAVSRGQVPEVPHHDDTHGYLRARIHNGAVRHHQNYRMFSCLTRFTLVIRHQPRVGCMASPICYSPPNLSRNDNCSFT